MALVSRDRLVDLVRGLELDDFDEEDTTSLVDILLEAFTPYFILTWMYWIDDELGTTPIVLIQRGQIRRVIQRARNMVAEAS